MRFLDSFRRTVRCHGDEAAIITDDGSRTSYREFDDRTTRLANVLDDRLGDAPVASLGINGPEMIESMITGHKRGTPTLQLPFRAKAGELVRMCEAVDAAGLIFDDAKTETARAVLERGEFDVAIHAGEKAIDIDSVLDYEAELDEADSELSTGLPADGDVSVFYTSGTTSLPKAVPFDSEQLWYGAIQGTMEHGIDHTDVGVMTTPWYHMVSSDAWLYPHFLAGASVVVQSDFDPTQTLELIEANEATGPLAVPTQLTAVNDVQADAGYETGSLTYIRTGGSVVSEKLIERTSEYPF